MSVKNPKIESIIPLSYLQRALLFHSLAETKDQGIIQVTCQLRGAFNRDAFEKSWQLTVERHGALRSSVHWEKVKEPVQVVRPQAKSPLVYHDLEGLPEEQQQKTMAVYRQEDELSKFDLTKAPANRLAVFKTGNQVHELVWTSHHLLLDGWSAGVILRDVFAFYNAEVNKESIRLSTLPSLQHYTGWLKKQDRKAAAAWWEKRMEGFSVPTLLGGGGAAGAELRVKEQGINQEDFSLIESSIREHRLTLNTVAQGLWGLLLGRMFSSEDVLFGTTVSGRTPEVPRHDEMAGLFTNAIPIRVRTENDQLLVDWLHNLQVENLDGAAYDFAHMGEITEWSGVAPNVLRFDHLLLVQNYPWSDLTGGGITVENFSGDLTSTHPLVVMLRPQDGLNFNFRYDPAQLPEENVQWLLTEYTRLFRNLPQLLKETGKNIQLELPLPPSVPTQELAVKERAIEGFAVANSTTELTLVGIWEELLSLSPIGVEDDFFSSGGTSLLAIRLFSRIETTFGKKFPPISLLQNRSIRRLAKLIDGETVTAWTNIVPLKASGSKPAIFCFHAGMGHVFFYHPLAKLVDEDRPLYAIQPTGLNGEEEVDESIHEMSKRYLREIQKVQPEGPYIFLAYCFSTAVCVELCHLLKAEGKPPPIIIVVDSAPLPKELNEVIVFRNPKRSLKWFAARLYRGDYKEFAVHLVNRFLPTTFLPRSLMEELKVNQIREKFVPLYEGYIWRDIDTEVFLIRSSEFAAMPVRQWHLDTWNQLSNEQLKTVTLDAAHVDFFEAPAVERLAETIEDYLADCT